MCGRFALHLRHNDIRALPGHDDVEVDDWVDEDQFVPRYNVAPRTYAPVIRRADPGPSDSTADSSSSTRYILQSMKWGLVPHWSKHEDKTLSTTNARSENLVEGGGMWGSIKGKKRCVLVTEGYYEWLTKGKEKLPHFTKHKDGRLMLLAGLYDCAYLEGSSTPLWTFTIVTTSANKSMSWLHDRQPVILPTKEAIDTWLDTTSQTWTKQLSQMVEPYRDESGPLECYPVPKEVGKVGTESSTFIEPVSQRKDGIEAMFSRQKKAAATTKKNEKPSSSTSLAKRKRSSSESQQTTVVDLTGDDPFLPDSEKASSSLSPLPPKKQLKLDADADADSKPSGAPPSPQKKVKASPAKKSAKSKQGEASSDSAKITTFFAKS